MVQMHCQSLVAVYQSQSYRHCSSSLLIVVVVTADSVTELQRGSMCTNDMTVTSHLGRQSIMGDRQVSDKPTGRQPTIIGDTFWSAGRQKYIETTGPEV